ncbi:helix-turn-helix domain-containing protein [Agromyces sp. Marseille-P2726]|uniref:AraC family transcriptional regulator n=1 Tax=Agromyces sp. Marseille-P2726 TaxID=2709132 RepID=UPI0015714F3E|nr:helix-turn-helix domain-containing protein [Agromyces sp. Marseille-P2726]
MIFEEREPPAEWRPFVTRLWYLEAARIRTYEKILPLPFVHVIVNLSDPYRLFDPRGAASRVDDAFVSGIQSEYLVIESPTLIRHVGVEFTPQGLRAFSEAPPSTVTARVRPADEVLPGIAALARRLRAAVDAASRSPEADDLIGALAAVLRDRRRTGVPADPIVTTALDGLASDPHARIGALAPRAGVSHKTLITHFVSACGITPKRFAEVLRFHRFVTDLPIGDPMPSWAELAAASPYYDQPHVIRAFRRFSGYSPADYLRRVSEFGPDAANFVPLDEVPLPVTREPGEQACGSR